MANHKPDWKHFEAALKAATHNEVRQNLLGVWILVELGGGSSYNSAYSEISEKTDALGKMTVS